MNGSKTMGVLLLGGLLLGVLLHCERARQRQDEPPASRVMAGWDIPRLVRHLQDSGLDLHAVSTGATTVSPRSAYLTSTERAPEEIRQLRMVVECTPEWRGVVYCERIVIPDNRAADRATWGACSIECGPFLFFGDPELLWQIEAALASVSTSEAR